MAASGYGAGVGECGGSLVAQTYVIIAAVCLLSSTVGAICGIGGGVIIKPVLDALDILPVATINFLSGVTVLCMAAYSVLRAFASRTSAIDSSVGTPLAIGAAAGGVCGRQLYSFLASLFANPDTAGACQAVALALVTFGTLVYTLNKERVVTRHVTGVVSSGLIGCALGSMSSFLGIGGGPINLVVLSYFYSMDTKTAAQNSLYIILFSQATSTLVALFTTDLSSVGVALPLLMATCGILGGVVGRAINARIDARRVDRLFVGLMVVIIGVCLYNALQLGGFLA